MKIIILTILALLSSGCATLLKPTAIDDEKVLFTDKPRIRNSEHRMLLADPAKAAKYFSDFAVMSSLAYNDLPKCGDAFGELIKESNLRNNWKKVFDSQSNDCSINGMVFHVWELEEADKTSLTISFRGTNFFELSDWFYGNLSFLTRFAFKTQYELAVEHVDKFLSQYKQNRTSDKPLSIYTAGHSLGGGLAQHIYYARDDIKRVFAFDPSPITGFTYRDKEQQKRGCSCGENPDVANIYRFYESGEILATLRFPLKIINPIRRHIHEVKVFYLDGHSVTEHNMHLLAEAILTQAKEDNSTSDNVPWYANKDAKRTETFIKSQNDVCNLSNEIKACPL